MLQDSSAIGSSFAPVTLAMVVHFEFKIFAQQSPPHLSRKDGECHVVAILNECEYAPMQFRSIASVVAERKN